MNTLQDLEVQYKKLGDEIEKLKKQPQGVWEPIYGNESWNLHGDGLAYHTTAGKSNYWELGMQFPTEEAAKTEAKNMKTRQRLKELAKGFKPDWSNKEQYKCVIHYNHSSAKLGCDSWSYMHYDAIFFSSTEDAKNAIKELEQDLLVLFGVK